jgi:hypothetical protein
MIGSAMVLRLALALTLALAFRLAGMATPRQTAWRLQQLAERVNHAPASLHSNASKSTINIAVSIGYGAMK